MWGGNLWVSEEGFLGKNILILLVKSYPPTNKLALKYVPILIKCFFFSKSQAIMKDYLLQSIQLTIIYYETHGA